MGYADFQSQPVGGSWSPWLAGLRPSSHPSSVHPKSHGADAAPPPPLHFHGGGAGRSSRAFRVAGGSGRIWILRAVVWGRAGWAYGSAALNAGGHAAAQGHLLGAWWGPGREGRRRVPGTVGRVGGHSAGFSVRCTLRTGAAAARAALY